MFFMYVYKCMKKSACRLQQTVSAAIIGEKSLSKGETLQTWYADLK